MTGSWNESRAAFAEAARWFVATAAWVGDRWDDPGLGEWSVRELVGHTSRSLLTVEEYLAKPAESVQVESAAGYIRAIRPLLSDDPSVAQRGRDAAAALGDDPAAAVAAIAERVLALVESQDGTQLPTTLVGGMRLADYLPTRTFELVIHTCDLCRALTVDADVPQSAATATMGLITEVVIADGRIADLLLGVTGRTIRSGGLSVF